MLRVVALGLPGWLAVPPPSKDTVRQSLQPFSRADLPILCTRRDHLLVLVPRVVAPVCRTAAHRIRLASTTSWAPSASMANTEASLSMRLAGVSKRIMPASSSSNSMSWHIFVNPAIRTGWLAEDRWSTPLDSPHRFPEASHPVPVRSRAAHWQAPAVQYLELLMEL